MKERRERKGGKEVLPSWHDHPGILKPYVVSARHYPPFIANNEYRCGRVWLQGRLCSVNVTSRLRSYPG